MTKSRDTSPSLTKETKTKVNVVEGVLQNYLDQLLVSATQEPQEPQRVEKVIEIPDEVSVIETAIVEAVVVETAVVTAIPNEIILVKEEYFESVPLELLSTPKACDPAADSISYAVDTALQKLPSLTDPDSWSSQGVECLIFSVCGLKLAVPLLFLGGVHEVTSDQVRPLVGQPGWYLGMVHTDEHNLQVIDTASLIMPERKQHLAEQGFKYLIQLEKTPWAIACQSIDDTVRLGASEIKWRGERGKRAWLAGTVIERMCALVDVNGLLQHVDMSCKPV
ncbi:MAG: purine-binding chemotaxis protein CheW [Oleispira sp.]